jgi:hypothetical protein
MLKEVTGDILLSTAGAIAHGIAPTTISSRAWPCRFVSSGRHVQRFRHYCQTYNPKPGGAWSWKGPNSPVIINLFTQEAAGQRSGSSRKGHLTQRQSCAPGIEEGTAGASGEERGAASSGNGSRRTGMGESLSLAPAGLERPEYSCVRLRSVQKRGDGPGSLAGTTTGTGARAMNIRS